MKRIFTRLSVLAALCLLTINVAFAQNITIKGKVIDGGDKTPLPGVTILVKGTQTGTQTDANGGYSLSAPANATSTSASSPPTTRKVIRTMPERDLQKLPAG